MVPSWGMRLPRPLYTLIGLVALLGLVVLPRDSFADGRNGFQLVGSVDNAFFGFGTDGALTFNGSSTVLGLVPTSSTYTLTRDVYGTTIAVNTGVTINTAGYRIFASVALTGAGTIQDNGAVGTAAASTGFIAVTGGAGRGSSYFGSIGGVGDTASGGDGGGSASAGSAGSGGQDPQGFTGLGGAGGAAPSGGLAAGAGGTITSTSGEGFGLFELLYARNLDGLRFVGGTGGGAGGAQAGGAGGAGGGAGGGVIYVAAPSITFTGVIRALGGAGGAGNTYSVESGGGGGGGGLILIYTSSLSTPTYTTSVAGGAGGAINGGTAAGSPGGAGKVLVIDPGSLGNGGGGAVGLSSLTCGGGLTGGTITSIGTCAVDYSLTQARFASACGAGSAVQSVDSAGVVTCIAVGGGGLSGLTTNAVLRAASSSTVASGTATDNGTTFQLGQVAFTHVTETTSGTFNDYALGSTTSYLEFSSSSSSSTVSGFAGGVDGRLLYVTASNIRTVSLSNESASSIAANRIHCPGAGTCTVTADGGGFLLVYDGSASRWRPFFSTTFPILTVQGAFVVNGASTFNSGVTFSAANLIFTGANGRIRASGTSPTLSGCGTSPTVTAAQGTFSATVAEGTSASGCTITFSSAMSSAPTCTVTSRSGLAFSYTTSTTALTITNIGALSSTTLDFVCVDH